MSDIAEERRVTSADLLAELRDEQRSFRFLMRVLAVIVVVALLVVGSTVAYFYFRLAESNARLSHSIDEQREYGRYKEELARGEFARLRESNRSENLAFREEWQSRRRYARLESFLSQTDPVTSIEPSHVEQAIGIAEDHFASAGLNDVTALFLDTVLHADERGVIRLEPDQRMMIQAAHLDWNTEDKSGLRRILSDLYARGFSQQSRGFAAAALAELDYRQASANSMGWDRGCSVVVQRVDAALNSGYERPHLLMRKGECLRKNGNAAAAYNAFDGAAKLLDETREPGEEEPLLMSQTIHHGVGTTLVALAASDTLPPGMDRAAALEKAEVELTLAAQKRLDRGATSVGEAYTLENVGFIFVLEEDWTGALGHTGDINRRLPLAWNLTVRHIAAHEQEMLLKATGEPAAAIEDMQKIQRDTRGLLSLTDCSQIDRDELLKLLPEKYAGAIADLTPHCDAAAGGGL